jgi:hypothetical protein
VRPVWALYASALIIVWQRHVSLSISWDFDVLGKVIKKRRMFTSSVSPTGGLQVVHICLTLIISKPRFANPSEMSSAGDDTGRCLSQPLQASAVWDRRESMGDYAFEVRADVLKISYFFRESFYPVSDVMKLIVGFQ